jgi:molybdate transport system substrate-binding protein
MGETMIGRLLVTVARITLLVLLLKGASAEAAEIRVLCSNAITPIMIDLFAQFERASGHKLAVRYELGPVLNREIEADAAFDVAILSLDVEGLVKSGKIVADTRTVVGRTGIGVVVRKGVAKPDVSTTEAFKRVLLKAKSVSYSGGSSGAYFLGLLERLGIAEEMKAKLKTSASVSVVEAIQTGEPEIVVNGIAVLLMVPGAELVGGLPPELQNYVLFTGGVSTTAKEPELGRALLNFLGTPAAVEALKAKGLEPAT